MKSKTKKQKKQKIASDEQGDVFVYRLQLINGEKYISFNQGKSYLLDYVEDIVKHCKAQPLKKGGMMCVITIKLPIALRKKIKENLKKKKEAKKKKTTKTTIARSGPQKKSKRGKNAKQKIRKGKKVRKKHS